jgi:hypothetical protein
MPGSPGSLPLASLRRPRHTLGRGWTELDKIADAANPARPCTPGLTSGSTELAND